MAGELRSLYPRPRVGTNWTFLGRMGDVDVYRNEYHPHCNVFMQTGPGNSEFRHYKIPKSVPYTAEASYMAALLLGEYVWKPDEISPNN